MRKSTSGGITPHPDWGQGSEIWGLKLTGIKKQGSFKEKISESIGRPK